MTSPNYKKSAAETRRCVLELIYRTKSPHIGSAFSVVEVLTVLYHSILRVDPRQPHAPERDRLILSKGHACATLYALLHKMGFITAKELDGFARDGGTFEQHPNLSIKHGIEVSTGSLGHGLSIGAGMALASRASDNRSRVFVLLSDGEMNEGSVWEAVMFAGHHRLNNLVALIDANKIQALGHTSQVLDLQPLEMKLGNFGWESRNIDGHDFLQIHAALSHLPEDKPCAIILNTTKGKGVSFMEDRLLWHYRCPDKDEFEQAMRELG